MGGWWQAFGFPAHVKNGHKLVMGGDVDGAEIELPLIGCLDLAEDDDHGRCVMPLHDGHVFAFVESTNYVLDRVLSVPIRVNAWATWIVPLRGAALLAALHEEHVGAAKDIMENGGSMWGQHTLKRLLRDGDPKKRNGSKWYQPNAYVGKDDEARYAKLDHLRMLIKRVEVKCAVVKKKKRRRI